MSKYKLIPGRLAISPEELLAYQAADAAAEDDIAAGLASISATAPVTYDSGTRTIGFDESQLTGPLVANGEAPSGTAVTATGGADGGTGVKGLGGSPGGFGAEFTGADGDGVGSPGDGVDGFGGNDPANIGGGLGAAYIGGSSVAGHGGAGVQGNGGGGPAGGGAGVVGVAGAPGGIGVDGLGSSAAGVRGAGEPGGEFSSTGGVRGAIAIMMPADPSAPQDGDVWVSSLTNSMKYQANDVIRDLGDLTHAISTSSLDIYVDASTGDDLNDGSAAHPVQTFPAALALIPGMWQHKATIHLAAGTYTLPDLFVWHAGRPVGVNAALDYDGTVTSFTGGANGGGGRNLMVRGAYEQLDSGTITSVTNTSGGRTYQIFDTSKTWTANAEEGFIVRITDGAAAGVAFSIRNNTATMLESTWPITPAITAGSHYVIERPASIIAYKQVGFYGSGGVKEAGISFDGVQWTPLMANAALNFFGLTSFHNGVTFGDGGAFIAQVVFHTASGYLCGNRGGENSTAALRYWVGAFINGAKVSWLGHSEAASTYGGIYAVVRGASASGITSDVHSAINIFALDAEGQTSPPLGATDNSSIMLFPSSQSGFSSIRLSSCTSSHGAVWLTHFSTIRQVSGTVSINGSTTAGIILEYGSEAYLVGALTGTANGTAGISAQTLSRVIVGSGVTVTGASVDVLAGVTAGTWAGIMAGTPLTEVKSQTAIIPNV